MEDLERAQARLDNVRSVEPILSALRTVSLGSWKAALKQSVHLRQYGERLMLILPLLVPHLPARRRGKREPDPAPGQVTALVIGSERGLCGRFNTTLIKRAEQYLAEQKAASVQVELMALGTRLRRLLQQRGHSLTWSGTLSLTALPPYAVALDLTSRWLTRYEAHALDAVDLIYNTYHSMGRYEPTVSRLLPPRLPAERSSPASAPWPPPIIETDPLSLYVHVVQQWASISLHRVLLDSAAAEHSARYQLMEGATQNADRMIEELTLAVQTARQHEITQEMQELAAGAGLIGPR
jgi:F-type H+-transporting ATPase subunit gamma